MISQGSAMRSGFNGLGDPKGKVLACALALPVLFCAPAHAQTIEVVHFWKSPAERAALDVFADSFEGRGGTWYGTIRADQTTLKSYAIDRISTGNSPSAVQWHGGPEINELIELDIVERLEAVSDEFDAASLFPAVADALIIDGETSALPVGIHGENWVWQNLSIYRELDLEPPQTWGEFLAQAKLIRDSGYTPLAVGDAPWERAIVFNSILLGIGDADLHQRILSRDLDLESDRVVLEKVLDVFMRVRDEVAASETKFDGWLQATKSVIAGQATMHVMGDWAKGEFLQAGKTLGEDFDCSIAFSGGKVAMVLDVFVLPESSKKSVRDSQRMLIETVLDPKNQRDFSMLKGSLPVVSDVDQTGFDRCALEGMEAVADPDGTVPGYLLALPQEEATGIGTAVEKIWKNEDWSVEEALVFFVDRVNEEVPL